MNKTAVYKIIGGWLVRKYRTRAKESNDYYGVAKTLRKQGYPLEVTMLVLFGRM